jgi:CTP synthase
VRKNLNWLKAKTREVYGKAEITERHRHRYEMNDRFIPPLEEAGMKISGYSTAQHLVETVEIPAHPWFIAVQFHPEFTSSPRDGHPLFASFIDAAKNSIKKAKTKLLQFWKV